MWQSEFKQTLNQTRLTFTAQYFRSVSSRKLSHRHTTAYLRKVHRAQTGDVCVIAPTSVCAPRLVVLRISLDAETKLVVDLLPIALSP